MKMKLILCFFLGVILISVVNAELSEDIKRGLVHCWDDDTDGSFIDLVASNDGVIDGATYNASCKLNGCYQFDGSDDEIVTEANVDSTIDANALRTVAFFGWLDTLANDMIFVIYGEEVNNKQWGLRYDDTDGIEFWGYNDDHTFNYDYTTLTWKHNIITNTADAVTWYIDNVSKGAYDNSPATTLSPLTIGNRLVGDRRLYGKIDNLMIWNRSINASERGYIYNSGTGLSCADILIESDPPSMTLTTTPDVVNGTYSYQSNQSYFYIIDTGYFFNFSVSSTVVNTSEIVNCSLYLNGSLETAFDEDNITSGIDINFTVTDFEKGYILNVSCVSDNITTEYIRDIFIDVVSPTATITLDNNSIFYINHNASDFNYNATFSDTNLYAVNATLKFPNGTIKASNFTTNITTDNYNLSYFDDLEDDPQGKYSIELYGYDSHTAKKVKPLQWYFNEGNLIADDDIIFSGNIKEVDKNGLPVTYFYLDPILEDRYKLKVTFEENDYNQTLYLETTGGEIDFLAESSYMGHFVYLHKLRWIDFESDNIQDIDITQVDTNKYKIEIDFYEATDEIEFESIGSVNTFEAIYYFNLSNSGILGVTYSNYTEFEAVNYTRLLNYNISYACFDDNITLYRIINNVVNKSTVLNCSQASYNDNYRHSTAGVYNIAFQMNNSNLFDTETNSSFTSDLENPQIINLSINFGSGFVLATANVTLKCIDDAIPNITYNMTWNDNKIFQGILANNTEQTNTSLDGQDGTNTLIGNCSDLFGSKRNTTTASINVNTLYLIDELENAPLNLSYVTTAVVYFDDNSTKYDFKANNATNVTFSLETTNSLRFEFTYSDGSRVIRYVDISLLSGSLRVCGNKENITHYEQIIQASTQKEVIMRSVYSNCVVASDYTRFAYQNSLILKAYTINTRYYLYTYDDDGVQTLLGAVDGSVQTYINLDTLEFNARGYDTGLTSEALTFKNTDYNETTIYYRNLAGDNVQINSFTIRRLDTNVDVISLTNDSFTNLQNFTYVFNSATLNNTNETTLYRIQITVTKDDGTTETLKKYFNQQGDVGTLTAGLVFIIGLIFMVFGLSMTASGTAFSYFGVFIVLLDELFLTFAVTAWYITFLQGIGAILLIFITLTTVGKNYTQIA